MLAATPRPHPSSTQPLACRGKDPRSRSGRRRTLVAGARRRRRRGTALRQARVVSEPHACTATPPPRAVAEPEHPRRRHHRRRAFIAAEPPWRHDRTPKARSTSSSSLHRPVHQGGAAALRPRPPAGHRVVSSSSQCDIAHASTVFDEAATATAMSSPYCTSSRHQPSPRRLATAAPRPAPPSSPRRHQW